jgi:DNA-binding transcriptional LysR family regulator
VDGRLSLWGIEVFLAVAEEGAITAAARRLGVSPSAVSQQIAALEGALGTTLLDRAARPAALTPAGTIFRRHAQVMLNAAGEARAALATADMTGLTTLRLGVIEDFDAEVTPALLADLARDLKDCRFLLETGPSHRLLDGLDGRALDVVVAADLAGASGQEGEPREEHPLLAEPFVAVAPKGADIAALPLIRYTQRHHMGRLIAAHLARQDLRLSHRYELDSYSAIFALVGQGAGWTILTPLAIAAAERFRAVTDVRPLPFAPLDRRIILSARPGLLGTLPAQIAERLRGKIDAQVVAPMLRDWPWMAGALRVL